MKRILVGLLLVVSAAGQAQNITGKVCLESDRSPVPYATVGLMQLPDSSMVTGVITLGDGGYLLEKVNPGDYYLRVSYVGYKTTGRSVSVGAGDTDVMVDTILMTETTASIDEIMVVGERLKGKEMVDRTSYAIPDVVSRTAQTAMIF
jgi:hypothetical protein